MEENELDMHPSMSEPAPAPQSSDSLPADEPSASRSRGRKDQCQVEGCTTDLTLEGKAYCLKRRLCNEHMRADAVQCRGREGLLRFCFQCGKLEPLSRFEGNKRSCKARLQQRKQRETRRCNSDVAYRFSLSQQHPGSMHQGELAMPLHTIHHAKSSGRLSSVLADMQEKLLPLQLRDLDYDYNDELGEEADQQQPAMSPSPLSASISKSLGLAPVAEGAALVRPDGVLEIKHESPAVAAGCDLHPGVLPAANGLAGLPSQASFTGSTAAVAGFQSSSIAVTPELSTCCNCTSHIAAQQQQQQQLTQLTQLQQMQAALWDPAAMSAGFAAMASQPQLVVSGPLPTLSGIGVQAVSGSLSGPIPQFSHAPGESMMCSGAAAAAPAGTNFSAPVPMGAVTAPGCFTALLPCITEGSSVPTDDTALPSAAASVDAGLQLHTDLVRDCLVDYSTDSSVMDEGLPYSDMDLQHMLEGALAAAARPHPASLEQQQQQHQRQRQPQQQQRQHQMMALVRAETPALISAHCGSAAAAAAVGGQSMYTSQTWQAGSTAAEPPTVLMSMQPLQPQQPCPVPGPVVSAATDPLPTDSVKPRLRSKAAVLQQLQRIHEQQLLLLQQLQDPGNGIAASDSDAAAAAGALVPMSEEMLQARLQLVQQQYAQMLEEVNRLKDMTRLGLDSGFTSCY